jgi:hypothetical protein
MNAIFYLTLHDLGCMAAICYMVGSGNPKWTIPFLIAWFLTTVKLKK